MPSVLHVGCGSSPLPAWLEGYDETRLDIDPDCQPDIVASLTDLGAIGPFDLVFSSHCLEHLMPHDVNTALTEFLRVLRPGGGAVILVPDLQDVRPTTEVLYESDAGPICGLDMYYGLHSVLVAQPYMAHRCGFVRETLAEAVAEAGFSTVKVDRLLHYNLMAVGVK